MALGERFGWVALKEADLAKWSRSEMMCEHLVDRKYEIESEDSYGSWRACCFCGKVVSKERPGNSHCANYPGYANNLDPDNLDLCKIVVDMCNGKLGYSDFAGLAVNALGRSYVM